MKKIFFYVYTLFLVTPYSLYAMHKPKPLTTIEKTLVFREINRRGLSAIANENNQTHLRISDTFFKPDKLIEHDPLATIIFQTIETIETTHGYNPTERNDGRYIIPATNYLGNYTQYYWHTDNKSIKIASKITNREGVMQIINHEKARLISIKKSMEQIQKIE